MLPLAQDPAAAYRKVELDARVEGSDGAGLTRLCLEESIAELARAHLAQARGDRLLRNHALTRAASGIAALSRGVAQDNPLRGPLLALYGAAEHAVRAALLDFRVDVLARVKQDLVDIRAAL